MDVVRWNVAFDEYALASATVEHQLSFTSALAHKDICMQIGLAATLNGLGRRAGMAPIYDEVCRKNWANRSAAGEIGFDVNKVALTLDQALLKQAEDIYDGAKGVSKGGAKGKAEMQCYKCQEFGHMAKNCPSDLSSNKGKKGKGKGMQCFTCNGFGHKSDECPSRGTKRKW